MFTAADQVTLDPQSYHARTIVSLVRGTPLFMSAARRSKSLRGTRVQSSHRPPSVQTVWLPGLSNGPMAYPLDGHVGRVGELQ